jgi:hypothetical protein
MLQALSAEKFQGELRQFGLACARRVWHLLPPESRAAVEAAERFAVGCGDIAELRAALAAADRSAQSHWSGGRSPDARAYAESAAIDASSEWPRSTSIVIATISHAAAALACAAAAPKPDCEYDCTFTSALNAELALQSELLRGLIDFSPDK